MSVALSQLPISAADQAASAVAAAADFDGRWAKWIARGRAHEQHVRQRLVAWVAVAAIGAIGAAIVYALFGR
jgi:phosphate/sulfate permease